MSQLATKFSNATRVFRSEIALGEDQMRSVAPSIFAAAAHDSRSARYSYIPTIEVLRGLNREGFKPFMVAQGQSRLPGKTEFTKHMIRMRHAGQVVNRSEVNEIILINSHDGASSYQMLAGMFRFVCCNGMVCGDITHDIRIPHKGNIQHEVIEGATRVLENFTAIEHSTGEMKALTLSADEERAYGTAALALRFGEHEGQPVAPISVEQVVEARRIEDRGNSLWSTFQRVQENTTRGGQPGRTANGRRLQTRPVAAIDRNVSINRALWVLAEEMRKIKTAV